ncbi:MAG: acyl--CoA ligase [Bacteroides sp.]|nr:acyl--CoA ligase [Bacillota bacterium]MCM1394016.1 acyl--CoA ligase [[Eubacterium] siraeum]MCM1455771.1 acyl--CoA ligase [Bacteroides sp.]
MDFDIRQSLYDFMKTYHAKRDTLAVARGKSKMNFSRFFKEVDRVAGGLYALGIRRGDVVMLALPNIMQSVVAVYAASRIGAVASMIHPLLSADEFGEAVKKQKPKAVFLSDINYGKFSKRSGNAKRIFCSYVVYGYVGLPRPVRFEPFCGDGEEPMFYMQSGGTSGIPKTVVLSSRACNAMAGNLLNYLDDKFDEKKRMLVALPMFHGFGLCVGVHASMCSNMSVVLVPRFDAKKVTRAIAKNKVTTMLAVPRMISKLLDYDRFCGEDIASLEDVYVGGDAVSGDLVDRFAERMKECGGHGVLSPGYGLSETVTVCTLTKIGDYRQGSVGTPILGVHARIVDENLCEVPTGETGELLIGGEQIMSGYLDDGEATKQAIVSLDGVNWVRTGDLFKADEEGRLYYLGRKKRLIKISGINVFPYEIERVARELSFIDECAAIEYRVNGKPFIRLIVEGELSDAQKREAIGHIARRMSHWNVPSSVVCLSELPRTKMSKIDILKLQEDFGG